MQEKKSTRQNMVASEVRRVLSEYLLRNPIADFDAKTSLISITNVSVSPCLQFAKVYLVSLSSDVSNERSLAFLKRNISKLKRCLGERLRLKFIPDIELFIDDTWERAEKIESLLKKIPDRY
ncbi:MAG: 30S ribosome-binding factor RbfA [Holosporaceae bacterium]|jgi:ribosome-binding factor A|nr:30S ribosome-binding factor RbfA [Holosporaceae bacterium]